MNYCEITLISQRYEQDEYLVQKAVEVRTQVFAKVKSASQSEFFGAGNAGLKPEYVFSEVKADEYSGETEVEYNGKRYDVYRTYQPREDVLELYVKAKVGV